jgi:calcium-dependent protein kinase
MLNSLDYCHTKGIIHRDLKPENFVFDTKDDFSYMRLIDFGVAAEVAEYAVVISVARSPHYAAPEVVDAGYQRTGSMWKACDMWSIGVITYLLVCGRPPFNGESPAKISSKIKAGKWNFPEHQRHKLSEEVKEFITRCLDPSWRSRLTAVQALKHRWI